MSDAKADTKLFDGFPIKPKREPRKDEALCAFACGTIIDTKDGADGADKHCGSCCPRAVELRTARVKPIHDKAVKEAKAAVEKLKAQAKPTKATAAEAIK